MSALTFAMEERRHLLLILLSAWRRRGASLLQVGLADLSPDMFWEAGFDVSALDASAAALERARAETGPKIEYHLGKADYLPFEDGAFDHVVLAHPGLADEAGARALEEAVRVAARGVIVLEWNRLSFAGAALARQTGLRAVWPWALAGLGREACPDCRARLRSALPLPHVLWPRDVLPPQNPASVSPAPAPAASALSARVLRRAGTLFRDMTLPVACGAAMALRLEKSGLPLTPAGLVLEQARAAYAGMARIDGAIAPRARRGG